MSELTYHIQMESPEADIIFDPDSRVKTWKQASEVIPECTFEVDDVPVRLIMNWGRAAEYTAIANHRAGADFISGHMAKWPSYFFETSPENSDTTPPLNLSCTVQTSSEIANFEYRAEYCVEFLLHQMFLAFNLSTPGCFDLSKTRIRNNTSNKEYFPGLCSLFLSTASDSSCKQGWPTIAHIPLSETWKWLQQLIPQPHVLARTRTEKALFALLHVCNNGGDLPTPADLIWLAHALEALFDTPETGISKALRDRLLLVLGRSPTNVNKIKKSITSFYDLRSKFVHGELDIAHPLGGPDEEQFVNMLVEQAEFGISLVLASLQLLIRNDWKGLEFSESFAGQPF